MSERKVPLPEPVAWAVIDHGDGMPWFVTTSAETAGIEAEQNDDPTAPLHTADQLQSYGDAREQAGWNAAIEWAAKKCELREDKYPMDAWSDGYNAAIYCCADEVREGRK